MSLDFSVPKLEGLRWVNSNNSALEIPRNEWHWNPLIRMPDFVTSKDLIQIKEGAIQKKGIERLEDILFESTNEGKCVLVMHVGSYSTEPETIWQIKELMNQHRLVENGLHHEIYLSDPRKIPHEKIKTILRQPFRST